MHYDGFDVYDGCDVDDEEEDEHCGDRGGERQEALQGLTITQAAALYYVRLNAGTPAVTLLPETGWYAEAITSLNGDTIGADGSETSG